MRYAALAALFLLIQPAHAAIAPQIDPSASLSVVQQWIYNYRAKPDYAHIPAAVRVLFHAQSFKEPENSGIYLGFIAGASGRGVGDRPRHRLFGAARLEKPAAQDRAANAGTEGDDRQLPCRHA